MNCSTHHGCISFLTRQEHNDTAHGAKDAGEETHRHDNEVVSTDAVGTMEGGSRHHTKSDWPQPQIQQQPKVIELGVIDDVKEVIDIGGADDAKDVIELGWAEDGWVDYAISWAPFHLAKSQVTRLGVHPMRNQVTRLGRHLKRHQVTRLEATVVKALAVTHDDIHHCTLSEEP